MKRLIYSVAFLICLLLMISLVSCKSDEERLNEATAPLNTKIADLNARIAELNSDITDLNGQIDELEEDQAALNTANTALKTDNKTLEDANAALEAEKKALEDAKAALEAEKAATAKEKAELEEDIARHELLIECAKGNHVFDGEGKVAYTWSDTLSSCSANYDCKNCNESVSIDAQNVIVKDGTATADFFGVVPTATYDKPGIISATYEVDSASFDESSRTLYLSEGKSIVLRYEGVNFDKFTEENHYRLHIGVPEGWKSLGSVYGPNTDVIKIEKSSITITLTYDLLKTYLEDFGIIISYVLIDSDGNLVGGSKLDLKTEIWYLPIDSEGYILVSDKDELLVAIDRGGKIKLTADIVSDVCIDVMRDTVLELAGYDVRLDKSEGTVFWSDSNFEVRDSVGGSVIGAMISPSGGSLKISGAISIESHAAAFNLSSDLDLSEYSGGEMYFAINGNAGAIILPEGYGLYSDDGDLLPDIESAREISHVYLKPITE